MSTKFGPNSKMASTFAGIDLELMLRTSEIFLGAGGGRGRFVLRAGGAGGGGGGGRLGRPNEVGYWIAPGFGSLVPPDARLGQYVLGAAVVSSKIESGRLLWCGPSGNCFTTGLRVTCS